MTIQSGDTTQRPDDDEEFGSQVRPCWVPWVVALVVAGLVIGVGSYFAYGRDTEVASMDMGGGGDNAHVVPPVAGFYEGQAVHFIHTEASDAQVAGMLSNMMGSPVIVARHLRAVPASALGNVFVFANGVQPDDERGPFGFQPDVFDTVPGEADYSPLRALNIVTWQASTDARSLRSVGEIRNAEAAGELTIEQPGVVVNMPIIDWPGGAR